MGLTQITFLRLYFINAASCQFSTHCSHLWSKQLVKHMKADYVFVTQCVYYCVNDKVVLISFRKLCVSKYWHQLHEIKCKDRFWFICYTFYDNVWLPTWIITVQVEVEDTVSYIIWFPTDSWQFSYHYCFTMTGSSFLLRQHSEPNTHNEMVFNLFLTR